MFFFELNCCLSSSYQYIPFSIKSAWETSLSLAPFLQEIPGVFRVVENFVEETIVNLVYVCSCVFHRISIIISLPVFFNFLKTFHPILTLNSLSVRFPLLCPGHWLRVTFQESIDKNRQKIEYLTPYFFYFLFFA